MYKITPSLNVKEEYSEYSGLRELLCVSVWGVSCGFLRELVAVLYQMNCRCSDPDVSEHLGSLLMNPCCDRVSRCRRFHSRPWWAKGQNPALSFLFSLWIAAHVNHARPLLPYLSLYHTFMAFYNKKVQDWQKLKPFFSISVCVCSTETFNGETKSDHIIISHPDLTFEGSDVRLSIKSTAPAHSSSSLINWLVCSDWQFYFRLSGEPDPDSSQLIITSLIYIYIYGTVTY